MTCQNLWRARALGSKPDLPRVVHRDYGPSCKGFTENFDETSVYRQQFKSIILQHSAFFIVQFSHPYMTNGKTIALTRWTFLGNETSLLFNMLFRLVITFLPRCKRLLISWLQSSSAVILEPPHQKKNKVCHCFHCFPIYLPWSDGTRCHDLCFLNVEF